MARLGLTRTTPIIGALPALPRWSRSRLDKILARRTFHSNPSDSSEAIGTAAKLPEQEPVPVKSPQAPVTINDILARRAKAGRLVAGTAAYSDSDMFKAPSYGKPKAKRWDHLLSPESQARQPCVLKQAAKHLKKPGLISLGGGLPCAEYFPIESLSMKVPTPPGFSEQATAETGTHAHMGKYDATTAAAAAAEETEAAEYDLATALNYGQAIGSAQLLRFVTEHTELVCNPPYADWRCALTVGSTGALETAYRMFLDRARGDAVLTEEYSFSTAVETAHPLVGTRGVVGVPVDAQGLLPGRLDDMLAGWDPRARDGRPRPRLLYTVPSGQNPTGATQGAARRRDIYEVARRHDLFILEDEPYYFLQMPPYTGRDSGAPATATATKDAQDTSSAEDFLASLVPSLLSMDVDGRVMRMDSFSKVVVPGSRLGWVTASEQVVERYVRHAEVASQGPSGFSQAVLHRLLDRHWGHDGYLRWLMHLRGEYTRRRDTILAACEHHLPADVVSWNPPAAGMFHWMEVNYRLHPDASRRSILDIEEEIFNLCIDKGVLVGRGSWFRAEHDKPPTGLFFRATFAAATAENMTEAIRRFGEAIRQSFKMS